MTKKNPRSTTSKASPEKTDSKRTLHLLSMRSLTVRDLVNFWEAVKGERATAEDVRQFRTEMEKLGAGPDQVYCALRPLARTNTPIDLGPRSISATTAGRWPHRTLVLGSARTFRQIRTELRKLWATLIESILPTSRTVATNEGAMMAHP
jgi:hypothetical protein